MRRYLILDVGSTTTKALVIEPVDGEYRVAYRGEAATTVEAPYEDVTIGVQQAVAEICRLSGYPLLADGQINCGPGGCTDFLATSSAGGGLQILVCGLVKQVTAESAQRAALGAGAILLDVLSADDGRTVFQRMEAIRGARPDMILLAGGVDGAVKTDFAVEFCDILNSARPKPRFGQGFRLPVIYAGNATARPLVSDTLNELFELHVVPNLRPGFGEENLQPTRQRIHDLFLSHVMQQAPGYEKLQAQTTAPILPTPVAVGQIMTRLAERDKISILGADIGGATTDIFSVLDGQFNRTVSANLGMSYSAGNVLRSAGAAAIQRWLPFAVETSALADTVAHKLINPTSVPATFRDLLIEQALAREALRLALMQHTELIVEVPRELSAAARALLTAPKFLTRGKHLIDLERIDLLVGSGGVLSHAPVRAQAALMLLDAFQPLGYTYLAVDSIFMMPHLGVLAQVDVDAALHVLERDCFVRLGPSFSLFGMPADHCRLGRPALTFTLETRQGKIQKTVDGGEILILPLPSGETGTIHLHPLGGGDIGAGKGAALSKEVLGGVVGVILDCRGRPLPALDEADCAALQRRWQAAAGAYAPEQMVAAGRNV